jgi:hypothetical protein
MPETHFHRCRRRHVVLATSIIVGMTMAGCGNSPESAGMGSTAPTPVSTAIAATAQPSDDVGHDTGYDFAIHYPPIAGELGALHNILHAYADQAKADLVAASVGAAGSTTRATLHLQLSFSIATQTSDFVSALANGQVSKVDGSTTPILASFTVHLADSTQISLVDLFSNRDAALAALSDEARRQLNARFEARLRESTEDAKKLAAQLTSVRAWVEKIAVAQPTQLGVFLVDGVGGKAIGLTLIFPRDPAAAWMESDPQVEVPSKIFYALLKPTYRDAFSIDPEDLKHLDVH